MTQATIAIVKQGDRIPFDGKILEGLAFVDESAQNGVSTPALLEASEGRNDVIEGTLVVEGWLKIESQPTKQRQAPKSQPEETPISTREIQSPPAVRTNPLIKIGMALLLAMAVAMVFALVAHAAFHSTHAAGATGVAGFLLNGAHSVQSTPFR